MAARRAQRWLPKLLSVQGTFPLDQLAVVRSEMEKASDVDLELMEMADQNNQLAGFFRLMLATALSKPRIAIPREAVSYEGLGNAHHALGLIDTLQEGNLWEHELVSRDSELAPIASMFAEKYDKILRLARDDIVNHRDAGRWKLRQCVREPDESYDSLGKLFQNAIRIVLNCCTTENVHTRNISTYCRYVCNRVARSAGAISSLPDIAVGVLRPSALPTDNVYDWCDLYVEVKNEVSKLDQARGQVLDRAEKRRKAAKARRKIVLGAASTGTVLEPMIVFTDEDQYNRVVKGTPFSLQMGSYTETPGVVHPQSLALPPLLFLAFCLVNLTDTGFTYRAAAGVRELKGSGSTERKYVVRSTDPETVWELEVLHTFVDYLFRGGTYLVSFDGGKRRGILKRGSFQGAKDAAASVGIPAEFFNQVETELRVRQLLGDCKIKIPEVFWAGIGLEPFSWARCPVLLMADVGESLLEKTLPVDEVVEMGTSLLETVTELHKRGIIHRDICPRNVAYRAGETGPDKFYLLDLGLAVCTTDELEMSPVVDLEFGSMSALFGEPLDTLADLEGILYTMVKVAGLQLPWSEAAAKGDEDSVRTIRREVLQRGFIANFDARLLAELQQLVFQAPRDKTGKVSRTKLVSRRSLVCVH